MYRRTLKEVDELQTGRVDLPRKLELLPFTFSLTQSQRQDALDTLSQNLLIWLFSTKDKMKERTITDLARASFLTAIGHQLLSVNPDGKRLTFSFEDSEKLEKDILAYYNRT